MRAVADHQQSRLLELMQALNDAHKAIRPQAELDSEDFVPSTLDDTECIDRGSHRVGWNGALPQPDSGSVTLSAECDRARTPHRLPLKLSICRTSPASSAAKRAPLSESG
jgi:hypothetical protein